MSMCGNQQSTAHHAVAFPAILPHFSIQPPRFAVVAPTFNNAGTLGDILNALDTFNLPVIAVNDGSTDQTGDILTRWVHEQPARAQRHAVTHEANLGKAAALRTGFELALRLGSTHAVTVDTDGQHEVADISGLLKASSRTPHAIVVGVRNAKEAGYPRKSRLGRAVSNTLVWIEAGVQLDDTQCGLRSYPLAGIAELPTRAGRYGYETEILTLAAWAGIPIHQIPVRCIYMPRTSRVSHFRPGMDSLSATGMHVRLLMGAIVRGFKSSPRARASDQRARAGTLADSRPS